MKKIIFTTIFFLTVSPGFSQTFMHGAGITILFSTTAEGTDSDIGIGEGLTYFPRINFLETESLSVSAGVPFVVGITTTTTTSYSGYSGYGNSNTEISFIFNAPLIINLNVGRGSTKTNTNRYGFFIGAGFGYNYGRFIANRYDPATGTYIDTYKSGSYGPAANGGLRIGVGRAHKNIEIRLSYMKGINETKPNVFGLAAGFNF